ncbi:MAG: LCP family protein [Armatimonadetes bacterium]|nr:LCP family protein [Armatimonadota bacterium]
MKRYIPIGIVAVLLGTVALILGKALQVGNSIGGDRGIVGTWIGFKDPLSQFPAGAKRINILLIGKDYNHTDKGILYTKNARADTLIVFSLDFVNKKVSSISIPRDTYIPERGGRINATYSQGGAELTTNTVGKLLGVRPDYYIALKPDGIKALVDELGGVEVTALDAMKYDDSWAQLHINLPEGTYPINGEQAVGYTRFRKSNPGLPVSKEEGDTRRMARQQNLIRAMVEKGKQPAVLMRADKVVDTAFSQVETDLSRTQLLALATIFRDTEPSKITSATLLGEDGRAGSIYVFKPDAEKTKLMVDWLLRGDEGAANALTVVSVQNGTAVRGAARRVAESLRESGYDARPDATRPKSGSGETMPEGLAASRIVYHKATFESRAQTIARLLGVSDVVKVPLTPAEEAAASINKDESPADVQIVIGRDIAQPEDTAQSAKTE